MQFNGITLISVELEGRGNNLSFLFSKYLTENVGSNQTLIQLS